MRLLDVKKISTFYGKSHILFDVSIYVNEGEAIALLGRNGAGKSTTFRSIMGLSPPKSGSITFKGEEIIGKRSYSIANKGIGYVPEEKRIFRGMTVSENLQVGFKKGAKNDTQWSFNKVYDLFPILGKFSNRMAGRMSGGEQQMLAIARTLMGNPDLLLLDEPTTGLSPLIVKNLSDNILKVSEQISILLAEQNTKFALDLSQRAYIIDKGEIRHEDATANLRNNQEVLRKYLAI
jgi:branched-chain amino acid transport system ATP-binding protein